MYAIDFEYAGKQLSDFGFIVCNFNGSSGTDTVTAGSNITFNKVSHHNGRHYGLTNTIYEDCIETTFHICKNPDTNEDMRITDEEFRRLMRWLNRKKFYKFKVLNDDEIGVEPHYFNASFNIEKINIRELTYGAELTMITDSPFAYGNKKVTYWDNVTANSVYKISDISDEIGYTPATIKVKCRESGNLIITNQTTNSTTIVNNCSVGETIIIDSDTEIITSSLQTHKLYNDFNFKYFKLINDYDNRLNKVTFSLNADVEISYIPLIKNAI